MSDAVDLPALIAALKRGKRFPELFYANLLALARKPGAIVAIHAALEPWQRRYIAPWLTRTPLAPAQATLVDFARLATRRARKVDRDFPTLRVRDLKWVSQAQYGGSQFADTRIDGRGWLFRTVYEVSGPAETREESKWSAVACGGDWALGFAQADAMVRGLVWAWPVDPLDPEPALQLY